MPSFDCKSNSQFYWVFQPWFYFLVYLSWFVYMTVYLALIPNPKRNFLGDFQLEGHGCHRLKCFPILLSFQHFSLFFLTWLQNKYSFYSVSLSTTISKLLLFPFSHLHHKLVGVFIIIKFKQNINFVLLKKQIHMCIYTYAFICRHT